MRSIAMVASVALSAALASAEALAAQTGDPAGAVPAIVTTSNGAIITFSRDDRGAVYTLETTIDRVWAALPAVYEELGIKAKVNDPARRAYGTQRFSFTRMGRSQIGESVRCGNEGAGPSASGGSRLQLSIVTTVEPARAAAKSLVRTQIGGTATPIEGTSSGKSICASTGKLEQRIAELLAAKVKELSGSAR